MLACTVRRLAAIGLTALAVAGCGGQSQKDVTDAQLALMPLTKAAYGPAVAPLTIDSSSGVSDNADAARVDLDPTVTGGTLAQLGRITGYALDFSNVRAFTSRTGLVDAASGVDLFEDADGAARYAAKQLAEPRQLERRAANGVTFRNVSSFRIQLESGTAEAVSGEIRLGGLSFWMTFSVFRRDKLVAEVALTRADGFGDDRARIVPLTRALDARIGGVLDGSVHGKPVSLPPSTRQELGGLGAPNGGPELADAILTAGDFGAGRLVGEGYARDQSAVAVYLRRFEPARLGTARLARADLTVQLHPSARDAYAALATRRAAVTGARGSTLLTSAFSAALGSTALATAARFGAPRTVRAGDSAFALRASFRPRGRAQTQLVIAVVNVGRLDQIVTLVGLPGARIPDTELTGLLRSAAGHMREALGAKKSALTG
jgi:hypothetical protein